MHVLLMGLSQIYKNCYKGLLIQYRFFFISYKVFNDTSPVNNPDGRYVMRLLFRQLFNYKDYLDAWLFHKCLTRNKSKYKSLKFINQSAHNITDMSMKTVLKILQQAMIQNCCN